MAVDPTGVMLLAEVQRLDLPGVHQTEFGHLRHDPEVPFGQFAPQPDQLQRPKARPAHWGTLSLLPVRAQSETEQGKRWGEPDHPTGQAGQGCCPRSFSSDADAEGDGGRPGKRGEDGTWRTSMKHPE